MAPIKSPKNIEEIDVKSLAKEEDSKKTPAKVQRTKKTKYVTIYSSVLHKETKHELIGEPVETNNGRQQ